MFWAAKGGKRHEPEAVYTVHTGVLQAENTHTQQDVFTYTTGKYESIQNHPTTCLDIDFKGIKGLKEVC